jgi:hypothetical protein
MNYLHFELTGIEDFPEVKYKKKRGAGVAFTVVPA